MRRRRVIRDPGRRAGVARGANANEDASALVRREKQTLIPAFDPQDLARELESAERETSPPPFDPASYARIVDAHMSLAAEARSAAETIAETDVRVAKLRAESADAESVEAVGRAMYGCYLASDFPEALVLAERVLTQQPDHALAQAVAERCRARLGPTERPIKPSSVVRLRRPACELGDLVLDPDSAFVLEHVDGVSSAAIVAARAGITEDTALDRLDALLHLGVLEVVAS